MQVIIEIAHILFKILSFFGYRQHFDLTSPSIGSCAGEVFSCPLCVKTFNSAPDLELHVNIEHRDVLSPASPSTYSCPVCGVSLENDSNVSYFPFNSFSTRYHSPEA